MKNKLFVILVIILCFFLFGCTEYTNGVDNSNSGSEIDYEK